MPNNEFPVRIRYLIGQTDLRSPLHGNCYPNLPRCYCYRYRATAVQSLERS
ncbi:unnamed protein product [Periconia digitata]|uniref:Uncharacterized protein n=1 Tax=Periconia digitata TaxID=1303443 RepID=A0A9W4URU6_9PLEO|nr:unnamed protein product [Periconia digitata]